MKLFGRKLLEPLRGKDQAVEAWVNAWTAELMHATWKSDIDVCHQYPKTYLGAQSAFQIPVGSQKIFIDVMFNFSMGIVIINCLRNE